jgi:hypothetical protein
MGRPNMGANGFPGKRVDPMRAGITATIFMNYPLISIARAGAPSLPANVSGDKQSDKTLTEHPPNQQPPAELGV